MHRDADIAAAVPAAAADSPAIPAAATDPSANPSTTTGSQALSSAAAGSSATDPPPSAAAVPSPSPGDDDRIARVALTWLAEPGNRAVWAMVRAAGAPATLDRLLRGDIPDGALRSSVLARTAVGDPRRLAEGAIRRAERIGARLVVPDDPEWPLSVEALAHLELDAGGRVNQDTRPPLCFWIRGHRPLRDTLDRSVAVVGARAATTYGTHVTTDIAYGLAERGWTVLSGGAFGIDAAAHRATLAADGCTVAVLACGVDRPYPAGNAALLEEIAERGLLVSEWPPGAEPLRHRFLIRNRVIAAATRGTVVVEAAARSLARHLRR